MLDRPAPWTLSLGLATAVVGAAVVAALRGPADTEVVQVAAHPAGGVDPAPVAATHAPATPPAPTTEPTPVWTEPAPIVDLDLDLDLEKPDFDADFCPACGMG